jgi:hypothetical protein
MACTPLHCSNFLSAGGLSTRMHSNVSRTAEDSGGIDLVSAGPLLRLEFGVLVEAFVSGMEDDI